MKEKSRKLIAGTIILFLISVFQINAKDTPDSTGSKKFILGFDGGMMLHTGYLVNKVEPASLTHNGATFGIGGALRLHLRNNFRIGSEGYVSTMNYRHNGSFSKTFWAGILGDWSLILGEFRPFIGVTIGGGTVTHCIIEEGSIDSWEKKVCYFNKKPFFALAPFLGCEYALTKTVRLILKTDFLMGFSSKDFHFPSGPRLYFGFIFAH